MTELTLEQAYVWLLCLTGAVTALTVAVYVVASLHYRKSQKGSERDATAVDRSEIEEW